MKSVIIFGCGWLGKPVGISLSKLGYSVYGSTTSNSKFEVFKAVGITPFQYRLGDTLPTEITLLQSPVILIAIPPSKAEDYLFQLKNTLANLKDHWPNSHVIFASSTSFYPKTGTFSETETFTEAAANPYVAAAEKELQNTTFPYCILRFGGLFNTHDRNPARWMKNKSEVLDGYANMVHQKDAAAAMVFATEKKVTGIYNVVAPETPLKSEFYRAALTLQSESIPTFTATKNAKKVLGNAFEAIGFQFTFRNPTRAFTTELR